MPNKFEQFSARRTGFAALKPGQGFEIKAAAGAATLMLYDAIGWPFIEAAEVVREIEQLDAVPLAVRVNSPGGIFFDGLAIYNALRRHSTKAKVTTHNDALAASAAAFILMAGDEVRMAETAMLMIHKGWAGVWGNADDLREAADVFDKFDAQQLTIFTKRTGFDQEAVLPWFDQDTWFTAQEAKANNLIDVIQDGDKEVGVSSEWLALFENAPQALRDSAAAPGSRKEPSARQLERALQSAGCSRAQAQAILSKGFTGQRDAHGDMDDLEAGNLALGIRSLIGNIKRGAGA